MLLLNKYLPGLCIDESVLRDLKALLIEARQKVPPFLATLDTDEFIGGKESLM